MTPELARIFPLLRPCSKTDARCGWLPAARAARTMVEQQIWLFSLARLRLLENKVGELGIVDRARDSTIGRAQKNTLQPHRRQHWGIPPTSAFVAAMEDVLAVYTRARDGDCPLVCLDETSKQLIAETRAPISMKAG